MNAPLAQDWTIANQQLLVAEFARLKERLPRSTGKNAVKIKMPKPAPPSPTPARLHTESAIDWLTAAFGLSGFERDLLLLCAGAEMDAELARACALPTATRRGPGSPSASPWPLESPHWSALTPQRPLRRWRLLEIDNHAGLAAGRLRIDERVLHFLVGINELDVRLAHLLRPAIALPRQAGSHAATTQAALAALNAGQITKPTPANGRSSSSKATTQPPRKTSRRAAPMRSA
jgi:hypothetical protein